MRRIVGTIGLVWALAALGGAVSSSPFGVNVHLAADDTLQQVADAGIQWVRIDVDWRICEPAKGDFHFADVDRVVHAARSRGLSILAVLAYTPAWANEGKGGNYPADNTADWKAFVRVAVKRYQDRIRYWNIWNEPNVPDFFAPGKDVFLERVFLPGVQALRKVDPGAFVVGPELAHLSSDGREWFLWMKYILSAAGEQIDVVSHHLYDSRGGLYVFEALQTGEPLIPSVRELVAECGLGDRPFWLTETGWSTLYLSEEIQARNYMDTLQLRRSRGYPDKIFFYEIRDDADPEVSSWGILRSDGSAKPAYQVYRDFIQGKINDGGPDPIPEETSQDCYAERLVPTTAAPAVLTPLRRLRDDLSRLLPGGDEWIDAYYRLGPELADLSLRDSRLYRSGVRLMRLTADWLERRRGGFWTSPLPDPLYRTAADWLQIVLDRPLSPPLRRILRRGAEWIKHYPPGAALLDAVRRPGFVAPRLP